MKGTAPGSSDFLLSDPPTPGVWAGGSTRALQIESKRRKSKRCLHKLLRPAAHTQLQHLWWYLHHPAARHSGFTLNFSLLPIKPDSCSHQPPVNHTQFPSPARTSAWHRQLFPRFNLFPLCLKCQKRSLLQQQHFHNWELRQDTQSVDLDQFPRTLVRISTMSTDPTGFEVRLRKTDFSAESCTSPKRITHTCASSCSLQGPDHPSTHTPTHTESRLQQ